MAALASLTEMYTDSEGEDGGAGRSDRQPRTDDELLDEDPQSKEIRRVDEVSSQSSSRTSNLVSYLNDPVVSDEDNSDRGRPVPMDETSTASADATPSPLLAPANYDKANNSSVDLPTEPTGKCSNEMQQKILLLSEKMLLKGHDMNQIIQERKSFRNPSIYEKLIQFCGINEFGTNYAPQIYDPHKWNRSSYYDELAKVRLAEMEKRDKEVKEKAKVEIRMGTAKKPTNGAAAAAAAAAEEERKRKSKWDQVGLPGAVRLAGAASLITFTTSSTGTKSTVISAFGSLPKKPKT